MRTVVLLKALTFVYGCNLKPNENVHRSMHLKNAEWLIGTWESKTESGNMFETWSKYSDKEFIGKSYLLIEEVPFILETLQLIQEQDSVFYIPTVKNQNDNLPVRFSLQSISDTELVFENLKHDFPQTISYFKKSQDSLVAVISGLKNGRIQKHLFPMHRVK